MTRSALVIALFALVDMGPSCGERSYPRLAPGDSCEGPGNCTGSTNCIWVKPDGGISRSICTINCAENRDCAALGADFSCSASVRQFDGGMGLACSR